MVAVAATAAKMVTVAPAGLEAGSAMVTNVTTAFPKAVEASQTVIAATEVGAKVVEVAPDAMQAAGKLDSVVDAGGTAAKEAAMGDLVNSSIADVKDAGQVAEARGSSAAEISTEATEMVAQRQKEIQQVVQSQMNDWDKSNPPGDDIQGWIERRAAAEKQFTVNEGVNRDLAEWQKENPQRENETPEMYAKRLAEQKKESQHKQEELYDQMLQQQQEKRQGMSKAEFMRRYAQLQQLRIRADQVKMNMQNLRASPYYNETLKAALGHSEATLNALQAEITNISADLQLDAVITNDPWKSFILPALAGASLVMVPAVNAANEQ